MIPENTKDPIVLELARIAAALQIPCTFLFVNEDEGNFVLDNIDGKNEDIQFPALVFVATSKNKETVNEANVLIRKAHITVMLLDQYHTSTVDYKTREVNPIINRMRMLAENLFWSINESDLSVAEGGMKDFETEELYAAFDANLFGVEFTGDWTINTGITGCYH